MANRRKTIWYVEIKGGDTNEAAMEYLAQTCDATLDKFERIKDCAGVPHNLLCVDRAFINTFIASRKKFSFMFIVYNRQEGNTCVRACEFSSKGKIFKTKKFRIAQKWHNEKARKK